MTSLEKLIYYYFGFFESTESLTILKKKTQVVA